MRDEREAQRMSPKRRPAFEESREPLDLEALRKTDAGRARGRSPKVYVWAAFVLAVLAAFALRAFRLDVSWDIFVDEIFYLRISRSVVESGWVNVTGTPFYLHPPGFFFLEAGYMKLLGIGGGTIEQIYDVRYLGAALAGISAGALLWLGRRLAGWPAGIAAAAIFALDPFSIKMNSRNLLETPTMLWVLLGYGVLFSGLVRSETYDLPDETRQEQAPIPREPMAAAGAISRGRVAAAGVLFGLAILTKEVSVFLTLLPLGICFVLGWALPRARSVLAGVVAVAVYSVYPAVVYAMGDWGTFVSQKFDGVARLAGLLQITGFNQGGGGPSLLDAVISRLGEFATTYALLGTGAIAAGVLLFTRIGRTPPRRLLLAWAVSAYAFLGYAAVLGTLEEQFFYYLVVTCILVAVATTAFVLQETQAVDSRLAIGAAMFVVAFALWGNYVWASVHAVPDNGYERVVRYVERLPEDSRVAVTSDTAEFLVRDHAGTGVYTSVRSLQKDDIDYVVISSYLATKGYTEPPPKVFRWVQDNGRRVYGFENRSTGLIGVWRLPDSAVDTASSAGASG